MNRTLITLLGAALAALVAIVGLLFLMARLSAPTTAPVLATPDAVLDDATSAQTPEVAGPEPSKGGDVSGSAAPTRLAEATPVEQALDEAVIATVAGMPITRVAWQSATRLDAVMSRLTGQPIPSPEETLDRLINEILLLRGADLEEVSVALAEVEARVASLEASWGLSEAEIVSALEEVGLNRQSLLDRVARLILIERAIEILSVRHPDLDAWLAQARQAAEVGLYQSLEVALWQSAASPVVESSPVETLVASEVAASPPAPLDDLPIAPVPGAVAPDFALTTLDSQTVRLSDLRGRPVLLNFWATWCPPCRAELPALQSAYERYGDRVTFLGVNVKEPFDTVTAFVPQSGLTFPILLDGDGAVSYRLYQVRGIPISLFLAPDGVVSARHVGPLTEADMDGYLAPFMVEARSLDAGPVSGEDESSLMEADESQGELAPDFTLDSAQGVPVTLSDFRGKSNVVLAFYRGQT